MKTTIDLPDAVVHRAKIVAAQRRATFKQLVMAGLELVLRIDAESGNNEFGNPAVIIG